MTLPIDQYNGPGQQHTDGQTLDVTSNIPRPEDIKGLLNYPVQEVNYGSQGNFREVPQKSNVVYKKNSIVDL